LTTDPLKYHYYQKDHLLLKNSLANRFNLHLKNLLLNDLIL
jgi:hypothetical protein